MVVHQPFEVIPHRYMACIYDYEHITEYVSHAKKPQGMQDYLNRYVRGVNDFSEYLELVGGLKKMASIKADSLKILID